jgi:nucleobase:cation symporter-1, NCS1 family
MFIEQHSIDYVPLKERHGKVWHLWPIWFTGDAHLATLAVGVLGILLGGNLIWTAIAVVSGCAFGTFFMAFHSAQGPQLGLPQLIQSRPQFGYLGALLVWLVALVAYIGYNAVNQQLAVQALHGFALTSAPVANTLFMAMAVLLALIGYDWIHRAQRWLAYLMLIVLTVFTLGLPRIAHFTPDQWDLHAFRMTPFLTQFFAAAAYQLSWSIYVSDYSRYLPRDVGVRSAFVWTYMGSFIGGAWMMLVGTFAAALYPLAEVAGAAEQAADAMLPGFGKVLLGAALLGLMTITALNFYGASLTLLSIADSVRPGQGGAGRRVLSLIVAAAATILITATAAANFMDRFLDLLALLLYLLTPWTAINLVDFYWVRKGHYSVREIFNPHGLYGRWNWRGLMAYGVGFAAMIPFFSTDLYRGPVARALGGADIAMLVGLPVAALTYLLACRSLDLRREGWLIASADQGLDPPAAAPLQRMDWHDTH